MAVAIVLSSISCEAAGKKSGGAEVKTAPRSQASSESLKQAKTKYYHDPHHPHFVSSWSKFHIYCQKSSISIIHKNVD